MVKKILLYIMRKVMWIVGAFFPLNKNKIIFSSYYGRGYGDNPKYIAETLIKQNNKLKLVWVLKNNAELNTLPDYIIPCKHGSLSYIFHLVTAKIWIDNCRKSFLYKKKNQIYIQTWHGFALKRIEEDVQNNLSESYVKTAKKDSKAIDIIFSDSKFMSQIYKKSFWYNSSIVEYGSPRNDVIINKDTKAKEKVYEFFNIDGNKKILMYAPTFRGNKSLTVYSLDIKRVIKICESKFGGEFVCLVRLHPNIADKCGFLEYNHVNLFNATYYADMQELLVAADIVVSDYSSLMFDFALSNKPCFQFATDIEDYKKDRNFYFDLYNLPFGLAKNNDEMMDIISNFDQQVYQKKLDEFFKKVGMVRDGKATERCSNWILKIINKNRRK